MVYTRDPVYPDKNHIMDDSPSIIIDTVMIVAYMN